jgi:hypothetical protein
VTAELVEELRRLDAVGREQAKPVHRCRICHRKLSDPWAIFAGMGRMCYAKWLGGRAE